MTSIGRGWLVSLVAAVAAVAAYHVLAGRLSSRPPSGSRAAMAIDEIRAEFDVWRRDVLGRGLESTTMTDAAVRIGDLERRLAELERTAGRPKAPVALPSSPPPLPLPTSRTEVATEGQLLDLERMLRAVSEREAIERESTSMWGLVRNAGVELLPAQESSAVTRLLGFRMKVRAHYAEIPDQSKMTPADILAFEAKIKDLRAALQDDLTRIVGAVGAAKIAEAAPPARRSTHPESTPPGK